MNCTQKIRKLMTLSATVLAVVLVKPIAAQRYPEEQSAFSAEDTGVNRPVPIPPDVMDILRKDDGVQNVLESENVSQENLPASWFQASVIHLGPKNETDLIVVGEPPLVGGNVGWFWIFRLTPQGPVLVLHAYRHTLVVRKKRFHGYREIQLLSNSAVDYSVVLVRFNGTEYEKCRSKTKPIR